MNEEKNKERIETLYQDIKSVGKLEKIKNSIFDNLEYHKYLKKVCEYNIRSILLNYYNGKELTDKEKETLRNYSLFSGSFYDGKDSPDSSDIRLQSKFGSGDFDYEELDLIRRINNENKQHTRTK